VRTKLPRNTVLVGDVRTRLKELPSASVDCVVTSPPYFLLRDYDVSGQIGHEATVTEWVDELRIVLQGIARVLKPMGSVWLNVADSYSRHARFGAAPKSLLLGPERLAVALEADGWTIRNRICWAKSNPMPASVTDRLTCTWEFVYVLTRSRTYFFDLDAIRIPHTTRRMTQHSNGGSTLPGRTERPKWAGPLAGSQDGLARLKAQGLSGHRLGKNPGDHWVTAASNYRGAHFATFPTQLLERPILVSCPERTCTTCGSPWKRMANASPQSRGVLSPQCACRPSWRRGVVLDPFFGAGTVGVVAEANGRDWLGIELNPAFAGLATRRITEARVSTTVNRPLTTKGGAHHGARKSKQSTTTTRN
jgi:DNA modification methylase